MKVMRSSEVPAPAAICVALELEAKIAGRHFAPDDRTEPSERSLMRLANLRAPGCKGLVSLGLAGGLCDDLSVGDVVVASEIVANGQRFATDDEWAGRLLSDMPSAIYGPVTGSDVAVTSAAARYDLARRSGALAVDMESHAIARMAAVNGIPFLAVRVVMDGVQRRVPEAAVSCISSSGQTSLLRLGQLVLRRPRDASAVFLLCSDWPRARHSLDACCRAIAACEAANEQSSVMRAGCP
ncbi:MULTISPECIES: phosphorylase family protein [Bradyrhizobium]|uniref:phosphorylase family protein n=1 Tax=Bradyrhizobium TaxID=374 RepID=UPI000685D7BA|nr:hypothetical protein [Bradyrhizobium sp. CCBAU 53380]